MDFLESLDAEVSSLVDNMPVEVLMALIEKWDYEMEKAIRENRASIPELLNHYVRLKIAWHHVKRHMEWEWTHDMASKYETLERDYRFKIREARRNYYVARIRDEGHDEQCACRGCKCIGGITGRSERPSPGLAGRTGS